MYTIAHKKRCSRVTLTILSRFLDWSIGGRAPKTSIRYIKDYIGMRHLKALIAACLSGAMIAGAGSTSAEERPVLVDRYTSQGCSACPPADEFMHELIKRDDVIALALHVDYWDYIGWKDVFAQPAFTERQKAYAKTGGRRSVYTPQMIIAGQDHISGTQREDVGILIQRHAMRHSGVALQARRGAGGQITITAETDKAGTDPLGVYLVQYIPSKTIEITRGENAGRSVTYVNIVTDWSEIGQWDMSAPLTLQTQVDGDAPGVIVLQRGRSGPVMAAAHLR